MNTSGKILVERAGNRRRLVDALEGKFTGEVPFLECYVAENIVDRVLGKTMGSASLYLPPGDYVEFLKRTGMDAAYLYEGWFLGRRNRIDKEGHIHYIDGTIKTRDDFDQIVCPSLAPVKKRIEGFLKAAEGTDLGLMVALDTSVSLLTTAIGPADSLILLYDDPDFIHEFCDRVEEYTMDLVECVVQYPLDAIWLSGLRCCNTGPMMSPAMHEAFIFPRIEKVMDRIRPSGIPVILHTDGDNSMFMDWIIQSGFAGLHPIEPGIGNFDIYKLRETVANEICLCGNIDVASVLSPGSPERVRADVTEHIRGLAPGGGYVCGSSHDISGNIPFENFCALAQTICSTVVSEDGSLRP